jgi:hypothetical protein
MTDRDEFYIGYESGMPQGMRRVVTSAVVTAIVAALSLALVFVMRERDLANARFEFGTIRTFSGYLALSPAPVLITVGRDGHHLHWLVAPGKFGAATVLGNVEPGWITLAGTLVEREQWKMIEVVGDSVRRQPLRQPPRRVVLTGEIVDGKCYLGVMNPGERHVHRDCAVRCLAGGVPAMLAYRDEAGSHLALLLGADAEHRAHDVGRQVTLSGELAGPEDALVFKITGPD